MAKRGGAVHVATTRRHYKDKVYETTLLRRSYREGGKVKTETLANLSHLPPEAIAAVRASLAGQTLVAASEGFEVTGRCPTATSPPCAPWPASSGWPSSWPGLPRAGPGPGAGGGQGVRARLQAGHHPVVGIDHPGRGPGCGRGVYRRRLRRHGLALLPPGRHRNSPRPPAPGPRGQGALRPVEQLGGGQLLPSGPPGLLARRQNGQSPDRVRAHLRPRGPPGGSRGLRRQHRRPQRLHLAQHKRCGSASGSPTW